MGFFHSPFAETIYTNKYAMKGTNGRKETWPETCRRVVESVVKPYLPHLVPRLTKFVEQKKFVPGGRYFYAAGRTYPQVNNCLSGDTKIVTRHGIKTLLELEGEDVEVRNRYGEWEQATVRCFGVQRLFRITLTNGDEILATANHRWWQSNGERVTTAEVRQIPYSFSADTPLLDEEGIRHGIVFGDGTTQKHVKTDRLVLCRAEKESLASYFPQEPKRLSAGLTITKLPRRYKSLPNVGEVTESYARGFIAGLIATDGSTKTSSVTIACNGFDNACLIRELAVLGGCVVMGVSLQKRKPCSIKGKEVIPSDDAYIVRIKPFSAPLIRPDQIADVSSRTLRRTKMDAEVESVEDTGEDAYVYCCVVPGSESFTLANGLITSNCFLLSVEDSKEDWGRLMNDVTVSLMTGGGVGVVYSKLRAEDELVNGMGGRSTGPCALMRMVNEAGRYIMQGGSRRSAIWAGLLWSHPDIFKFINMKEWSPLIHRCRNEDFNFPAPMDGTNVSVILDTKFFTAFGDHTHPDHYLATRVYKTTVESMLRTGEPGFSIDIGSNEGENLRNACTEVCSRDNRDMCNLGSVNLANITSEAEFGEVVELGTVFLLCGTLYSKLPVPDMYKVREKNRRLGLGLMGVHEWLLKRGKRYEPDLQLAQWLEHYVCTDEYANQWSSRLGVSCPVATRSVAPTGTISIVAETTSGIEPIFAVAYKRRYLDGKQWKAQYVVDATAKRLIDGGVDPDLIEDACTLAEDVERRIAFQSFMQSYVDHGISSTINLPEWGSPLNNADRVSSFGDTLMKYLPTLRGITVYPNGSRGGQPLTRVSYRDAIDKVGKEFVEVKETGDISCVGGFCNS